MKNPFRKTYSASEQALFDFLGKINLFKRLTPDEMSEFTPFMHLRDYVQNEAVFFRNDPSAALYLIKDGFVNLNIDIDDRLEQLTVIRESEAFGDNSLLKDYRRIYNAIVGSEEATMYVIPHVNIREIFNDEPKIRGKMMEALAMQYNHYTENLFRGYKNSFGFFNLGTAYELEN
ncbi:MAG TPA: cyclic nucleotide-binding domain-containing protein [Cytophagales bacterium]|nr:cyclic nucleotide-binding domain-containing protein [Cytophagales bacterium]